MRSLFFLLTFGTTLSVMPSESRADDDRIEPSQAIPAKRDVDLSGEWRVFLPAGYEHNVTITRDDSGEYRVTPSSLSFSSEYRVEDGFFVSTALTEKYKGEFYWKQNSPYLLTLTKQTARVGSEYVGAVLFRNRGDVPKTDKRTRSNTRLKRLRD